MCTNARICSHIYELFELYINPTLVLPTSLYFSIIFIIPGISYISLLSVGPPLERIATEAETLSYFIYCYIIVSQNTA